MPDKATQRIAVMKDVIAQLNRKDNKLKITTAIYLGGFNPALMNVGNNIQEHVDVLQSYCDVCFKGAVFLSKARVYNQVYSDGVRNPVNSSYRIDYNDIMRNLSDIFDRNQLNLMEWAFERYTPTDRDHSEKHKAMKFGLKYSSAVNRAKAIAKNVIANNGLFVP